MFVIILYLLAVLMIDYDRQIPVIQIFADDPAVLRVIGENFNIPTIIKLLTITYSGRELPSLPCMTIFTPSGILDLFRYIQGG